MSRTGLAALEAGEHADRGRPDGALVLGDALVKEPMTRETTGWAPSTRSHSERGHPNRAWGGAVVPELGLADQDLLEPRLARGHGGDGTGPRKQRQPLAATRVGRFSCRRDEKTGPRLP